MEKDLFSLKGKTALVTGGTRGIGAMIAKAFLERGAQVFITARKAESCAAMQEEFRKYGPCTAYASDLSTMEGIEDCTQWLASQTSTLDILVNNAGAAWGQPIEEMTEDGWDRVMDLNVKSMFFIIQKLLPLMQAASTKRKRGRIINIGSIEGSTLPLDKNNLAYPASKAAVHHLTRVLARRLAANKITVNAVAPGPFESKMTAYILATDEGREMISSTIPLGRIGTSDDIAGLLTFMASRASDYITGTTIPLDGGYMNLR